MTAIRDVADVLMQLAPLELAESWDNVGLLVGDDQATVQRVMTCLTVTGQTADEAVREKADLIVTHHPLPFRPLQRITTETTAGRLLWTLAANRVAIYSLHTAYDSSPHGINQHWAQELGLQAIQPLRGQADPAAAPSRPPSSIASQEPCPTGPGRFGQLPAPLPIQQFVQRINQGLGCAQCKVVISPKQQVQTVAVACGSAGEFLADAVRQGCDTLITGEATFHTCLEAQAQQLHLILTGHFASERFGVEQLARQLQQRLPELSIWASRDERPPWTWM